MATGRVSGHVIMRPIRVALLVRPGLAPFHRAVAWATSTWGGVHTLLFEPRNGEQLLRKAEGLGIDVLYPVDEDEASRGLADAPGYQWYGRGEWAPYAPPKEYLSARVLGPEWLLDRLPEDVEPFLPRWSDDDPLAEVLAMWLGIYGDDEYGQRLAAAVARRGHVVNVTPDEPISFPEAISPIELTAQQLRYTGLSDFHGFAVVDVTDATHLRLAWNVRALGGDLFPWPLSDAHRLEALARRWIDGRLHAGSLSTWRRGDGTPLPPQASVMLPEGMSVPEDLARLLEEAGVAAFPHPYFVHPGWTGSHPFSTEFERSFSSDVAAGDWSISVPLPEFALALRRDPVAGSMTVAVQVELFHEQGLGMNRWGAIPNVRALASVLRAGALRTTFRRPVLGGRALGIEVSAEECQVDILPAIEVVAKLFDGSGWECSQSDSGRFAARLSDILGGPGTVVANQPAVREVLARTVRSPTGKTVPALRAIAREARGSWPKRLLRDQTPDEYAQEVVDLLLYRKLLRPYFAVRCPECAISMTMRPEDLASTVRCEMCSAEFPLGYAIGQARAKPGWQFRIAQDISADALLEATALLAAASAIGHSTLLANRSLHQFGVELKTPRAKGQPRGHECELDLFMVVHDGDDPEVIVGEVKNSASLEQVDLDNLLQVQRWFIGCGINCYPLFATLREALREEERNMLRSACEQAPRAIGSQVLPLFPIVLLRPDLSTAPMEPDHPRSWKAALGPYTNLSSQSCMRHLGLQLVEWAGPDRVPPWQCQWVG